MPSMLRRFMSSQPARSCRFQGDNTFAKRIEGKENIPPAPRLIPTCTLASQHVLFCAKSHAFLTGSHWKNSEKPHTYSTAFSETRMNQTAARCHRQPPTCDPSWASNWSSVTANEDLFRARALIPKNRPR